MTVFSGLSAMALLNLCLDFCLEERESIWNEYRENPIHYTFTYIPL